MPESAKNAILQITDVNGQLRTIHCSLSSITLNQERASEVVETFCATYKSVGNVNRSLDIEGLAEFGENEIEEVFWNLMDDSQDRHFNLYPKGSGAGAVRYYGSGKLVGNTLPIEVPGFVAIQGSYEVSGPMGREVLPS